MPLDGVAGIDDRSYLEIAFRLGSQYVRVIAQHFANVQQAELGLRLCLAPTENLKIPPPVLEAAWATTAAEVARLPPFSAGNTAAKIASELALAREQCPDLGGLSPNIVERASDLACDVFKEAERLGELARAEIEEQRAIPWGLLGRQPGTSDRAEVSVAAPQPSEVSSAYHRGSRRRGGRSKQGPLDLSVVRHIDNRSRLAKTFGRLQCALGELDDHLHHPGLLDLFHKGAVIAQRSDGVLDVRKLDDALPAAAEPGEPALDLRDYMPAKDCRGAGIDSHKRLKTAITAYGLRTHHRGNWLYVHAGDWQRLLAKLNQAAENAMNNPALADEIEAMVARKYEIEAKKSKTSPKK